MAVAVIKDWLSSDKLIPSWGLSGLFHAAVLAAAYWLMPPVDRPPVGFQNERAQEIGIYVKAPGDAFESGESMTSEGDTAVETADAPQASRLSDPLSPRKVVPDSVPIPSSLPQRESAVAIGPGAPVSPSGLPDVKGVGKTSGGGQRQTGTSGGGTPGASFMGTKDVGQRVVFVIDCSHSMLENQAMQLAKSALHSSVNELEATQSFQIIFYNETPLMMTLNGSTKDKLYVATENNKSAAHRFIRQMDPNLGTSHFKAIDEALRLKPDMIFLLTDSGDPKLTPRELDELRRHNKGRTRIHAIEFGIGPELNVRQSANFLVTLSRENYGTYRYVDVVSAKLRRRSTE